MLHIPVKDLDLLDKIDTAIELTFEGEPCPELFEIEANYFDIPFQRAAQIQAQFPAVKNWLISHHDFEKTDPDLDGFLSEMQKLPASLYKLATMANSTNDALRMLLLVKKNSNLIGLCMGELGQVSRILGPIFGVPISYAAFDPAQKTAPGQLTVDELKTYRFDRLNKNSRIYGLIGNPVSESLSHLTHNAVMEEDAVYVKMVVRPEELAEFFALAKELNFSGLSVTMPLKEAILPFLDEYEPVGAINTLQFKEGKIFGFNTDGKGALDALEEKGSVAGKKMVILGAGGSAKAIAFEGRKRGAEVVMLNRILMAKEIPPYDILINATPVNEPISAEHIRADTHYMDIKTRVTETRLIQAAKSKGCQISYGWEMFVHQAAYQFKIWFPEKGESPLLRLQDVFLALRAGN